MPNISLDKIDEVLIGSIQDVEDFFTFIHVDQRLNFHPDSSFADYVHFKTDERIYSDKQVEVLDSILEACFGICEDKNKDIYEIGLTILYSTMKH